MDSEVVSLVGKVISCVQSPPDSVITGPLYKDYLATIRHVADVLRQRCVLPYDSSDCVRLDSSAFDRSDLLRETVPAEILDVRSTSSSVSCSSNSGAGVGGLHIVEVTAGGELATTTVAGLKGEGRRLRRARYRKRKSELLRNVGGGDIRSKCWRCSHSDCSGRCVGAVGDDSSGRVVGVAVQESVDDDSCSSGGLINHGVRGGVVGGSRSRVEVSVADKSSSHSCGMDGRTLCGDSGSGVKASLEAEALDDKNEAQALLWKLRTLRNKLAIAEGEAKLEALTAGTHSSRVEYFSNLAEVRLERSRNVSEASLPTSVSMRSSVSQKGMKSALDATRRVMQAEALAEASSQKVLQLESELSTWKQRCTKLTVSAIKTPAKLTHDEMRNWLVALNKRWYESTGRSFYPEG